MVAPVVGEAMLVEVSIKFILPTIEVTVTATIMTIVVEKDQETITLREIIMMNPDCQ